MAKGIIYIMTTAVPGLIKIGKTGSANFESRMYNLEHDGYRNVTYLKRAFAIEVEDYDDKEKMLHTIFEKSRVSDTELFALDVNVARTDTANAKTAAGNPRRRALCVNQIIISRRYVKVAIRRLKIIGYTGKHIQHSQYIAVLPV